jgi:hypothetical protein
VTWSQIIGPWVTNSHGTISQSPISQTTSRSSLGIRIEEEEFPPQDDTSGKRHPKWLQDTLKEAQGSMGNPKDTMREIKPSEIFCSYLVMVSNII